MTMSFHKKVLIGYVLFNVAYIALIFLNPEAPPDRATATDQDMIAYGVAKPVGVALLLTFSSIVVMLIYATRGMVKLVLLGITRLKARK